MTSLKYQNIFSDKNVATTWSGWREVPQKLSRLCPRWQEGKEHTRPDNSFGQHATPKDQLMTVAHSCTLLKTQESFSSFLKTLQHSSEGLVNLELSIEASQGEAMLRGAEDRLPPSSNQSSKNKVWSSKTTYVWKIRGDFTSEEVARQAIECPHPWKERSHRWKGKEVVSGQCGETC